MKFLLSSVIFLSISFMHEKPVAGLSNNQIRKICQKEKKKSACVKNLKLKKLNLMEGNQIEIQVIPFKK